ncbi:hypothetical protein CALCODRAFT_447556 [Calocera cornea HHB12733]|uniref:CSC1/OSCA1-like N-terminal transmembrane domain-containing protein n=1 Tax=Calocera cornea HHB12733 TaxID=1353952 RepID=A0A165J2R9_9BASI|nr:hypothetical protein CALCODRAFT_447556 [Calocera cornea HHB12733]
MTTTLFSESALPTSAVGARSTEVPITTIVTNGITSTIYSESALPSSAAARSTEVPVSTLVTNGITTTLYSESALPSSTAGPQSTEVPISTFITNGITSTLYSESALPNGTYIPYTTTFSGSVLVTSTFSLLAASASPSAVQGAYGSPGTVPVCAGQGVDSETIGLLASLVFSALLGLLLWIAFAFLRPRFPQVYAARSWFPPAASRPPELSTGLFAFLHPPVPLVPNVRAPLTSPTAPFPSDEQLSQRVLFLALRIVAGWSLLGILGAIPLYTVGTPCLGETGVTSFYGGRLSSLTDLSVIRLLELLDADQAGSAEQRDIPGSTTSNVRTRLIILAVLVLVLGVLPALWHLLREHTKLMRLRAAFELQKCAGIEVGWLAAKRAPGLQGMGERGVRGVLERTGVSMEEGARAAPGGAGPASAGGTATREGAVTGAEEGPAPPPEREVDVQGVFTIVDTTQLRALVQRRDEVLGELERAETRYIFSFRLEDAPGTAYGSAAPAGGPSEKGPAAYAAPGTQRRLGKRGKQAPMQSRLSTGSDDPSVRRSQLASPPPPSDFLAPSAFYKITPAPAASPPTPPEEWDLNRQVTGSRFRELLTHGGGEPFAIGSRIRVGESGQLRAVTPSPEEPVDTSVGPNDPAGGNGQESWELVSHEEAEGEGDEEDHAQASRESSPRSHTAVLRPHGGAPSRPPSEASETDEPFHLRPGQRPLSMLSHADLAGVYADIKRARSELKLLNTQIEEAQGEAFRDIARGERVKGWLLLGRGIRWLDGVQMIEGRSKDDVRWEELQLESSGLGHRIGYWTVVVLVAFLLALTIVPVCALALSDAPDFAHNLPFLNDMTQGSLGPSLAITLVPALAGTLLVFLALALVSYFSRFCGSPSVFGAQFVAFKAIFLILTVITGIWLIAISAILFGLEAFNLAWNQAASVADGSIYIAVLCLTIILNLACIAPALLLLNLPRLWKVRRAGRRAITPRERFRAMYPRFYNYAPATAFCIVGIIFAATFTLLFPLIGPAIVLLLLLSLVAHRFLVGYVYQRGGQTGGLIQIWILRRFLDLLALQPILLGLLVLSRQEWALGGALLGIGVGLVLLVEVYTVRNERRRKNKKNLSHDTQHALAAFKETISARQPRGVEGERLVPAGVRQAPTAPAGDPVRHRRGSIASILDMMAVTLAVRPSSRRTQPVPLATEHIDDLVSTVRAAHTHPDATEEAPMAELGTTPFEDPAEETVGLLYSPELLAPVPIVWLPDDGDAGVARAEAYDLQRYHGLLTIIDAIPRTSRT